MDQFTVRSDGCKLVGVPGRYVGVDEWWFLTEMLCRPNRCVGKECLLTAGVRESPGRCMVVEIFVG